MSQVAIILDVPQVAAAPSAVGPILGIAEDAARQVRNQFPADRPQTYRGYFTFSTTTTDSDPGAAAIRFNSATPAARGVADNASNPARVTSIFVDDAPTGQTSGSVASFLNDVVDAVPNAVKARLTITNTADPQNFAKFDVTDVTDASGYTKVVVTLKSFGQTATQTNPNLIFANAAALLVEIEPAGETRQRSASLDSVVSATADLSALTAAEIVVLNQAAVNVVLATIETITVAGAAAGAVSGITGLLATDTLVKVFKVTEANPPTTVDLTAEFTVTGVAAIDNTAGTSSAGESLVVVWVTE